MDVDVVSGFAGVILSLVMSYVPGANEWFGGLAKQHKQLMMVAFLLVAVLVIFGAACSGLASEFGLQVTCDKTGILALFRAFFAAAIVNQTTFMLSPKVTPSALPKGGELRYEDIK